MKLTDLDILTDIIEGTDWYHINKDGELVLGANSVDDIPLYKANDIYRALEDAPVVDPVKRAQWIDIYGGKYANPRYACSSCGGMALRDSVQDELLSWHEVQVFSDFCPHCGAKMDGGKENGK